MAPLFPDASSLILVAVMNDPRDLEIARLLGWYRIPLRSAPKVIGVDYLAFYQTAAFEDEKWQINYIAGVRGYELTTRVALFRDEPNHPNAYQDYYKIQLEQLIRLPEPILAEKWRRITFFYTTGELLLKAHSINQLVVPDEERPILWQALRERKTNYHATGVDGPEKFDLDPELLATLFEIYSTEPKK